MREGEVAFRGCEAGYLGADLLDCAHAEAVLGLEALDVFGVGGGAAVGEAGDYGLVHGVVGVESVAEELEVPGELDDLVVGVGRGAAGRVRALGCGGGSADEQEAAQGLEETHCF